MRMNGHGGDRCGNIAWIKLDRITKDAFPKPWVPIPKHEWWQMQVKQDPDGTTPAIGMVGIELPHAASTDLVSPFS